MTRKTFGSAFGIAALFAVGLGAQTPPPQITEPTADDLQQNEARTITMVGCIQQEAGANDDEFILADARPAAGGEAGAVGTSGTVTHPMPTEPTTDPTDPTAPPTDPAAPPADTTDRAATQQAMQHPAEHMGARSFELTGDREDDLKDYVGKRVEIVGTLEEDNDHAGHDAPVAHGTPNPDAPATTDRPAPTDTVGTSGTMAGADRSGEDRDLPRLKVTSVREVSGSCAPAGDEPDRR